MSPTGNDAPSCMVLFLLQNVGDGVAITLRRGQMIAERFARDPMMMPAVEGGRQAQMRGAGLFPECRFLSPIGFGTGTAGCPDLDPHRFRIAAFFFGQAA